MKSIKHTSAKPSHYDKEADSYDAFNEHNSKIINQCIESLLKKHNIKTVLDLTCGTGSQVFWLAQRGYEVVGYDINTKMLALAHDKAKKAKLDIPFIKGDMRTVKAGTFDAVLTIFNSIGHLTKHDFEKTIQNIYENLSRGGVYIFDIFNLSYLLKDDNITKLTIDRLNKRGDMLLREIQYSTIDHEGILASYDIYYEQKGSNKPKISQAFQTLQVYSAKQLNEMLKKHGFKVIKQCNSDGSRFYETTTERIMMIAQKNK